MNISNTHHPKEGHPSKSIMQVFVSRWNFRAFEERDFYRIDHLATAMGVLVHPNFSNELANSLVAEVAETSGGRIPEFLQIRLPMVIIISILR